MPISRFSDRRVIRIDHDSYRDILEKRRISFFDIHETAQWKYPTEEQLKNLRLEPYVWGDGDRLPNLAYSAYGNVKYWWVIARFNSVPTEASIAMGDVIYIPYPIELVIGYLEG